MADEATSLLLTVEGVSRTLAVSVRKVWRLDSAGKLPQALKLGGSKRWRRAEVAAWVAAGCPGRREWKELCHG